MEITHPAQLVGIAHALRSYAADALAALREDNVEKALEALTYLESEGFLQELDLPK